MDGRNGGLTVEFLQDTLHGAGAAAAAHADVEFVVVARHIAQCFRAGLLV